MSNQLNRGKEDEAGLGWVPLAASQKPGTCVFSGNQSQNEPKMYAPLEVGLGQNFLSY